MVTLITLLYGGCTGDIVRDLSSQSGQVILPSSPEYEDRRKVMNAACTARPAVIVVPNTEMDISNILKAASANNMEVSVRSGGHSYTCTNLKEGGVHIDMRSRLCSVCPYLYKHIPQEFQHHEAGENQSEPQRSVAETRSGS